MGSLRGEADPNPRSVRNERTRVPFPSDSISKTAAFARVHYKRISPQNDTISCSSAVPLAHTLLGRSLYHRFLKVKQTSALGGDMGERGRVPLAAFERRPCVLAIERRRSCRLVRRRHLISRKCYFLNNFLYRRDMTEWGMSRCERKLFTKPDFRVRRCA